MMIAIDFHTHIFPDAIAAPAITKMENRFQLKAVADGTLDGLRRSMEGAKIQISVNLPVITRVEQFESLNRFAREITPEAFDDSCGQVLSFGAVHPDSSRYREELRQLKEMGFRGIKLHPDNQEIFIDDPQMLRVIDYASELGFVIVVHSGSEQEFPTEIHCPPKRAAEMLRRVRPQRLVLAHLGGFKEYEESMEYLAGQDVYLDTGFIAGHLEAEKAKTLILTHGADRILMGSDSPWDGQRESVEFIRNLGLSREDTQNILYRNALKLLDLKIEERG